MSIVRSYSQNNEDMYIEWLLGGKETGFYVDIGANDPVVDSVTKYFYDKGWRGLHVEPIPRLARALMAQRPGDVVIQAGVGSKAGVLTLQEYTDADGLSTFSSEVKAQNKNRKKKEYKVQIRRLDEILESSFSGAVPRIDFMKVDVEGYEYEVLKSNNWDLYRPTLLIIEANHVVKDWRPYIEKQGYQKVFFDGLNEYYTTDSEIVKSAINRYPEYLIGPTVYNKKQAEHLAYEVCLVRDELNGVIDDKDARIRELEANASDVAWLGKTLLKQVRAKVDNRAARSKAPKKTLRYSSDDKIRHLVDDNQAEDVFKYTQSNDSRNIKPNHSVWLTFKSLLAKYFWISVSIGISVFAKVAKRVITGRGKS